MAQHPVGNGRQLKVGVHRCRDPAQLAAVLEQLEEAPQISGGRTGLEQGHGMTVSAQAVSVLCRTPVYSVAMQISYFHVPAEMPQDLRPDAAVVIDVLRATTTIAWALHNGAEAVQAFASLDDLRAAAAAWPADARLLLGERGGQMLEGFDLGNSPVAVTPERVAGKRLFMSTTNGTRALDRVREVPLLLDGGVAEP